ncbi:MAG TPA: 50S ribosomal protein L9 [Acidimicrobiia bacterium]|nr:50S ribosomal protein L9 [Acidimicrobiia bacterium]
MKVVLREDVDTLGRKGDLLDVADGYARNYLVPRGLAIRATKGVVAQAESMKRNREAREVRERAAAEDLAGRLTAGGPVRVEARAGEGGKLFGSVTSADIAAALLERAGTEIDRRHVLLDEPLHELGEVEVTVRLHPEVVVPVTIAVVAA